jgi:hypothetical protein
MTVIAAAYLVFYIALPRDGKVVAALRSNHAQACFVIPTLSALVVGTLTIFAGSTGA